MMELFPYQKTGVEWLKGPCHRLLADDPGLGKTIQAIEAARELGCVRVLVVCPAVAQGHWRDHFKLMAPDMVIEIVTYDKLSRDAAAVARLKETRWDLLLLDEAHYLKTKGTKRTKAVYGKANKRTGGLAECAQRVWLLTGTPSPNHAGELWTHLRALWPELILSKRTRHPLNEYEFQNQFCNVLETQFGRQIKGSKNLKVLRDRLAPMILRRKKTQVLPDLPPLVFRIEVVTTKHLPKTPNLDWITGMDPDAGLAWIKANATALASERRQTAILKAPLACEYIDNELRGNNRKLIVFAWHKDVLRHIMESMGEYGPVLVDGSIGDVQRNKAIEDFQTKASTRLFVGQIKACGVAITLTAASDILFVEQDWTPENNYQAACRAHRIGQKEGVLARVLTLQNSVDELVQRTLVRKQNDLAQLYD